MTILISSGNEETRKRWKDILKDEYQVLEASNVEALKAAVVRKDIDLILLHRSMVDMSLITVLEGAKFFVFADIPDDKEAIALLRRGAVGYANTYISAVRLKDAIRNVLAGRVWIGQKLMQKLIQGNAQADTDQEIAVPSEHILSKREWEVAVLVSRGRSNLEIAAELDISERTVKAHISSIFKKTKTESRLQLALYMKNLSP